MNTSPGTLVLVIALIWQVVDFLKELTDVKNNRRPVVIQACAWVGGIAAISLTAHAQLTMNTIFPGTDRALGSLDWTSVIFLGLMASSLTSSAVDITNIFGKIASNPLVVSHTPSPVIITGGSGGPGSATVVQEPTADAPAPPEPASTPTAPVVEDPTPAPVDPFQV